MVHENFVAQNVDSDPSRLAFVPPLVCEMLQSRWTFQDDSSIEDAGVVFETIASSPPHSRQSAAHWGQMSNGKQ